MPIVITQRYFPPTGEFEDLGGPLLMAPVVATGNISSGTIVMNPTVDTVGLHPVAGEITMNPTVDTPQPFAGSIEMNPTVTTV